MLYLGVVLLFTAGAAGALATEPVFPQTLQSWVATSRGAVFKTAKLDDQRIAASPVTTPEGTVPTGLLTVRDVGPTDPHGCPLANCSPGRLLTRASGELTFSAQVTPLAVAPDVDYIVVLRARDGYVYDKVKVKWSRSDLVGIDPAERSVSKRKEIELRHNRRVEVKAPYDDLSVPPFIAEYNQAFDRFAKAIQSAQSWDLDIDPGSASMFFANMPGYFDSPSQEVPEFGQTEIERIFNRHFTLELVPNDSSPPEVLQVGRGSGQPVPSQLWERYIPAARQAREVFSLEINMCIDTTDARDDACGARAIGAYSNRMEFLPRRPDFMVAVHDRLVESLSEWASIVLVYGTNGTKEGNAAMKEVGNALEQWEATAISSSR